MCVEFDIFSKPDCFVWFKLVEFFPIAQNNACICGFILETDELSQYLNMTDLKTR